MQVFIYTNENGNVSVGYPSDEAIATIGIHSCAAKGTPKGVPFWVVENESLPYETMGNFYNAWTLDEDALGTPSGYGIDATMPGAITE